MEDRCVLCGEIVPEGTHVCGTCKLKYQNDNLEQLAMDEILEEAKNDLDKGKDG